MFRPSRIDFGLQIFPWSVGLAHAETPYFNFGPENCRKLATSGHEAVYLTPNKLSTMELLLTLHASFPLSLLLSASFFHE